MSASTSRFRKSKAVVSHAEAEQAKRKLAERMEELKNEEHAFIFNADIDYEEEEDYDSIIVKQGVAFEQFIRWSDYEDDGSLGKVFFECDSENQKIGRLVVYTNPQQINGEISSEIADDVMDSIRELTDNSIARSISNALNVDCLVAGQGCKPVRMCSIAKEFASWRTDSSPNSC
jgi:hypothetical protein